MQKQRLYKSRLNNLYFSIKYEGERITEIKEEIVELKEVMAENDDDDATTSIPDNIHLKRKPHCFCTYCMVYVAIHIVNNMTRCVVQLICMTTILF